MYDASVGRWFNADPQNQFASPYLAMGNNWVMSVDPDGEFVFTAILLGAALGGMINGIMTDMAGGSFEEGFIKGAISGAVGAGAGAYVSGLSAVKNLGTGFYNGAIIGASGGFASGATASGLNEDNFGQILGNAGIGAGIGAAIGGLTAGLKAQSDGRDFWSGKQWNEITTGLGSEGATFADFEDALDWDVDKGLKLRNIPQKEGFDCYIACKKSVDNYFGVTQENVNSDYFNIAKLNNGLSDQAAFRMYSEGGYKGKFFEGTFKKEIVLKWVVDEMKLNHVVQGAFKVKGGYHASLIKRVRYLSDFSKFRISIMNPSGTYVRIKDFESYHKLFSLWRK